MGSNIGKTKAMFINFDKTKPNPTDHEAAILNNTRVKVMNAYW